MNNITRLILVFSILPSVAIAADCIDTDGDGWGWDGSATCTPEGSNIRIGACVDPDGDGWGWNGVASCIPGDSVSDDTPTNDDSQNDGQNDNTNQTSSTGSCARAADGSVFVSNASPINSNDNPSYYPIEGPQCVAQYNQFDGPGLSWGDFLFINNAWNGKMSTWNWYQCISVKNNNGNYFGSISYDWGDEDALPSGAQEWEVKSYPEIIFGTKDEKDSSGGCEQTGLPAPYSELPQITIDYAYSSTQTQNRVGDLDAVQTRGGDRNIAIESFFHSSCDIRRRNNSNIEFELMVWLDRGPERLPSGDQPRAVYTDSYGQVYDVYSKPRQNFGYLAYVARNKPKSGQLNWNEFMADAKLNASAYGIKTINDDWCLGNIMLGSEIWWGEGSIDFEKFQITRQY